MNKKLNDQELFKELCFLSDELDQASLLNSLSRGSDCQKIYWCIENFNWSNKCRYCKLEVSQQDFCITQGYWRGIWFPSHKECLKSGKAEEAYYCQCIDADCNDCRYFERKDGLNGRCGKFDKPMTAQPKMASGYPCFVHRLEARAEGEGKDA